MATPPDFTAGQVLTAAQMNAIGLWHISRTTIGSAVSSVTVSNAFSSDYDSYKIIVKGGAASTFNLVRMTLGATATGYYEGNFYILYSTGTLTSGAASNAAYWNAGRGDTSGLTMNMEIHSPFLAKATTMDGSWPIPGTTQAMGRLGGFLNDTTSYTAFTLTASTGTWTGGTIDVYGFRGP